MTEHGDMVYVVDDDQSIRDALDSLIRSAGFGVQTFTSAQEFLGSKPAAYPACLVLDISLPGLSGLELQRKLIEADLHIPIVFITGYGDVPMSVRAMKAGAVEFLVKPFREQDLLGAVQQALDHASARTKVDQRKELEAAARIQQELMAVTAPQPPYARFTGRNLPCTEIGGDFFTALMVDSRMVVAIADVSGKGIAAAVMASLLQGMIHEGLCAGVPLGEIARGANEFFCARDLGSRYATLAILSLASDGRMEYLNCGHIRPLLGRAQGKAAVLRDSNLPVGLFLDATFASAFAQLERGDRVVLVSDGVTEAESSDGEFFGDQRLAALVSSGTPWDQILAHVQQFCGNRPLSDDCTIASLEYVGC